MNWDLAIERNRGTLLRILALLVAMVNGGEACSLPRQVRCSILRLLRPAESAARRLVVVAAQMLATHGKTRPTRPARPFPATKPQATDARAPSFRLFDPRLRVGLATATHVGGGAGPRIRVPGFYEPEYAAPQDASPDDPVDARALSRRLQALQHALDDLPKQARRLIRLRARPDRQTLRPMRPGRPPGYRARPSHEVDGILSDCHDLALYALKPPDSS